MPPPAIPPRRSSTPTPRAWPNTGSQVATGEFGAHMRSTLENDGPVTLILDSETAGRAARGRHRGRARGMTVATDGANLDAEFLCTFVESFGRAGSGRNGPLFLFPAKGWSARRRERGWQVQVRESLEREVEACLNQQLPDVDLREVTLIGPDRSGTLRVVIDHPAGVDHGICEQVTRALQSVGLNDRYGIEVWSPGRSRRCARASISSRRAAIGSR